MRVNLGASMVLAATNGVSGLDVRTERDGVQVLAFVEAKHPDLSHIGDLLHRSDQANQWANRGPLYWQMRADFSRHMNLPADRTLVPMANGGAALEAIARVHDLLAGQRLRWIASAYSFRNLARGYFARVKLLDCDEQGLLDFEALSSTHTEDYDGVVLTIPFGLKLDVHRYAQFTQAQGKALIIDNAAGVSPEVPDWPWQAFSLHHTKPYGFGEGGLALVPEEHGETIYELVNYGEKLHRSEHWLTNAKLSDVSCAFLIDRLAQSKSWLPLYLEQRRRIARIIRRLGLRLLCEPESGVPLMSLPFLADREIPLGALETTTHLKFAKYYKPLDFLPRVTEVYSRLANIPCHPDVSRVSDDAIEADIRRLLNTVDTARAVPSGSSA